ncbi:MAG: RNA methyltransferase [Pseudomonadota bacterium]
MALERVRIVLVEPSHPGNIGGAARAMKNMCLSRLYLVRPEAFPAPEATARAAGADDILDTAVVCADLATALHGCQRVFATSARPRQLAVPVITPRACGAAVAQASAVGGVAVVFGREDAGLTNAELSLAGQLVQIPTATHFSSLNLAAAVQVLAYEILVAWNAQIVAIAEEAPEPIASHEALEAFYVQMEHTLVELNMLDPQNPRRLMLRMRRLFNRAHLENTEVNLLRGILSAALGRKYRWLEKVRKPDHL